MRKEDEKQCDKLYKGVLGAHKNGARKDPRTKEKHSVNEQILYKQSTTLENISIAL